MIQMLCNVRYNMLCANGANNRSTRSIILHTTNLITLLSQLILRIVLVANIWIEGVMKAEQRLADSLTCAYHRF